MNIDSRICEYVIADFVRTDTPILINHDSFIVPVEEENRLVQLMKEALKKVTRKKALRIASNLNNVCNWSLADKVDCISRR